MKTKGPIDAKSKFREGFIMILRPFKFAELKDPIQKLTIVWAYSEQPVIKRVLTDAAKEEADAIANQSGLFFGFDSKEERIEMQLDELYADSKSWEDLYEGDIVQAYFEDQPCRFYPEEYKIMSREKISELMTEEGYHTVISDELLHIKDFAEKSHYLKSRGVSKHIADKWASLSYPGLVFYKPYYGLLEMFARANEIYPDTFYEKVEGILIEN